MLAVAPDSFPAIPRRTASSANGSRAGSSGPAAGSSGAGTHRMDNSSLRRAGSGSRIRRAVASGIPGATYFSSRAASEAASAARAGPDVSPCASSVPQRKAATVLCLLDIDLIRDVTIHRHRRLPDLDDEGRIPLQEAEPAAGDDPQGGELFQPFPRFRCDEDDPYGRAQGGVGQARDQRQDLGADAVAALPARDRPSVRACRGMPQEGAHALRHGLGEDVLELAGAALELQIVQVEQVVEEHLRKPVAPDDASGALLPAGRQVYVLAGQDYMPRGRKVLEERLGAVLSGGAEQLGPGGLAFLAECPEQFEDLVLPVLGHACVPLWNRDFRKSITFDSGMGKEYRHRGQQTREQLFPMGQPVRQPRSEGSNSFWHRGHRMFPGSLPAIRSGLPATAPRGSPRSRPAPRRGR